jgi:hypothetical protein
MGGVLPGFIRGMGWFSARRRMMRRIMRVRTRRSDLIIFFYPTYSSYRLYRLSLINRSSCLYIYVMNQILIIQSITSLQ